MGQNDRLFFDAEQKDEELIAKIKAQPNFFLLINILPWDETFADGTTLLWKAARNNRWGLMKFLFEHKVDVNKADNVRLNGNTSNMPHKEADDAI